MKIERYIPLPPTEFTMTFTREEGWTIMMALNDAVTRYPHAAERETWKQWAKDLEHLLKKE